MRAAIVIPAWNCWEQTRACLDAIAGVVADGHRIVVVDNGSTDGTGDGLVTYRDVQVITNTENLGFAAACNQGARFAMDGVDPAVDVVLFLNNDTVPVGGWLDELLSAFADPRVGGAGPRSNFVSGPQVVPEAAYGRAGSDEHRCWEARWREARRGTTRSVRRLVGFALAVRAETLRGVGLFDERFGTGGYEDDDLCDRILGGGWDLVIADGSFVHHDGHVTFDRNGLDWAAIQAGNAATIAERRRERLGERPLISACLIVKNEEDKLVDCLKGLNCVVDEVVIYDTGSTDGTVALARRYGATVEEGYWDDDFARARNAALARCKGTWVLHVDADEVLETDPRILRGVLETDPPVDALSIEIYNLLGDGTRPGYTHRGVRLFRRERCWWRGRLHEQVMLRPEATGEFAAAPLSGPRIVHSGYTDDAIADHDKLARNLRVAEAATAEAPTADSDEGLDEPGLVELNLARSLAAVLRLDDALEWYEKADLLVSTDAARRMTRMHGAEAALAIGRADTALDWVARLRDITGRPGIPDVLEAQALTLRDEHERAIELLKGAGDVTNEDGFSLPGGTVEALLGRALLLAGRHAEAADVLLGLIEQVSDVGVVATIADTLAKAGRSFAELARVLPEDALLRACAALTVVDPEHADGAAEELLARFGARAEILAAAVRFGPARPVPRALVWSARLRAAGAGDNCPVLAQARHHPVPARRAIAAAAVAVTFGDPAAASLLTGAVAATPDDELAALIGQLAAMGVLGGLVLGAAASTAPRCRLLAEVLLAGGAPEVASELVRLAEKLDDSGNSLPDAQMVGVPSRS